MAEVLAQLSVDKSSADQHMFQPVTVGIPSHSIAMHSQQAFNRHALTAGIQSSCTHSRHSIVMHSQQAFNRHALTAGWIFSLLSRLARKIFRAWSGSSRRSVSPPIRATYLTNGQRKPEVCCVGAQWRWLFCMAPLAVCCTLAMRVRSAASNQ
jgi:hypothetical protein